MISKETDAVWKASSVVPRGLTTKANELDTIVIWESGGLLRLPGNLSDGSGCLRSGGDFAAMMPCGKGVDYLRIFIGTVVTVDCMHSLMLHNSGRERETFTARC